VPSGPEAAAWGVAIVDVLLRVGGEEIEGAMR
jgi:hypothetical protein